MQVAAGGGAVVQGAAMGGAVAAAAGRAVGLEVAGTGYYEVAPPCAGLNDAWTLEHDGESGSAWIRSVEGVRRVKSARLVMEKAR